MAMEIEQPAEGIYRIVVPTPYAVGPVNCYLLDGPEPVLVDFGPPTPEAEAALRAALSELRLHPSDLAALVLTHHHPDHAGGLRWLRAETVAPLYGHPCNDLWLSADPALRHDRLAFFADLYRYCGVDGDAAEAMRRRYADYDRPFSPRPVDVRLLDGETIRLADAEWQVLETPGHAGTHIGLVRHDGLALVGDTLLDRISSNALAEPPYPGQSGRVSAMLAYRTTLKRLALLPLGLLLPGHGSSFTGHAALIARRLAAQEERAARLLLLLQPEPATVLALAARLFPALPEDQTFLALSEVLGHLDILEEQQRVRRSGIAPTLYRLA